MSTATPPPPIILFYYPFSPWARKITAYLSLRAIPYVTCEQPVTLPRPNLAALGVKYRRIPLMSIGRDIYCDTLLILEKLESLYPDSHMGAKSGYGKAMERLLEKWTDVVVFKYAAAAIPTTFPIMNDDNFVQDRTELWGRDWKSAHQDNLRPEALTALRANFELLENSLLEDHREWILDGDHPSLADIHAAWIFDWLGELEGALSEEVFGKKRYPKTWDWIARYRQAVSNAKEGMGKKHTEISGEDAVKQILAGEFGEKEGDVDELDATGLKKGDQVMGWPTDTGFGHKDVGTLVSLTQQESVIASKWAPEGVEVRVHHPRWQFGIEKEKTGKGQGKDANGGPSAS